MTAEVVGADAANNSVPVAELPGLIRSVHDTLSSLGQPAPVEAPAEPLKPAVPIKRSMTDEYIVSLEDERRFKSKKRYLAGLGMTPAEDRAKWGLPADDPMVAPACAAQRSALAMQLGRKRDDAAPVAEEVPPGRSPRSSRRIRSGGGRRRRRGPFTSPSSGTYSQRRGGFDFRSSHSP